MGNRLQLLRRGGLAAATGLVLGAGGCALPNGTTGGDPLLGNFNRPIAPTPPPERGGLGLDSPAYDGGARIGLAAPDVPTPIENAGGIGMTLPQLTSPGLLGGRIPLGGGSDEPFVASKPMGPAGARLPTTSDGSGPRLSMSPALGRTSTDGLVSRPKEATYTVASGPADLPPAAGTQIRLVSYEALKDPAKVRTMEEGQAILEAAGARGMKTEQLSGGDWSFGCTLGSKGFEAHGRDPLEALKVVLVQVQKDR
jgi:hypothetical protein